MPFDKLIGHDLHIPQYHPYIAPPRPIVPWGQMLAGAIDKIASAADPLARKQRTLEMAKMGQQMSMLPMQGELQRAQMQQQMNFLSGSGAGVDGMKFVPKVGYVPMTPLEKQRLQNLRASAANQQADRAEPGTGFDYYARGHYDATGEQPQYQKPPVQYIPNPTPQLNVPPFSLNMKPQANNEDYNDLSKLLVGADNQDDEEGA